MKPDLRRELSNFFKEFLTSEAEDYFLQWGEYLEQKLNRKRGRQPGTKYPRLAVPDKPLDSGSP